MEMFTVIGMRDLDLLERNLRKLMKSTSLDTQMKLANKAGISQTNLSNILRRAVNPQLDTLSLLADALRVDTWELLATDAVNRLVLLYSRMSDADRLALIQLAESLAARSDPR